MKTKYIASILALLLFAGVFTLGLTINKASADNNPTLSISSGSVSSPTTTFTVQVQIANVNNLFGFDINITYDSSLITFSSLDNSSLYTIWSPNGFFEPLSLNYSSGYQTGLGYVRFAAVATGGNGYTTSAPTTLFTLTFTVVGYDNIQHQDIIQFGTVKLSDQYADVITPAALNSGTWTINAVQPGISFTLVNPNSTKPWEWGKYFEVQAYATNVDSLTGYDLKIDFNSTYMTFVQVQPGKTYVLGTPTVTSTPGVVELSASSGGPYTGNSGLLFTLTFQVQFAPSYANIWRSNSTNQLTATISLDTTYGSLTFSDGTLTTGSITPPSIQTITINLIQGDVDCNGVVNILDLRDVAAFYDQTTVGNPSAALYDIKVDSNNIIDIYDLVEIAHNFNYYKPDTLPADP